MTPNKAKLLDWIKSGIDEHNSWSPHKWEISPRYIKKRNKELAQYRDWQKAMNSYMAGRGFYNPEVHGPAIAKMYGQNRVALKRWRDEGYPRRHHSEDDYDNPSTLAGIMYDEYYPSERMADLSYPESEYIIGVGDDEAAADWAMEPERWSKKEYNRRMKALDDWYEMNYLDPMDLQ